MKLEDHIKVAKALKDLRNDLSIKKVFLTPIVEKRFLKMKSILDNDYHKQINEAQFKKLGHIYYGE